MRIGVLIPNLESSAGGSYTFVRSIIDELSSLNSNRHEIVFLVTSNQQLLEKKSSLETILLPKRCFSRISRLTALVLLAAKAFKDRQALDRDLVSGYFLSKYLTRKKFEFVWSLEPLGFPLAVPYGTSHWDLAHRVEPIFPEFSGMQGEWKRREKRNRTVLQRAALVCTGTKQGYSEIEAAYGIDLRNCLIVPMPVKQHFDDQSAKRESNLFIYPAQFWPHKNHVTLIRAFHEARKESGIELQLVLTGSDKGFKIKILNLVKELSLEDSVLIPGFVTEQILVDYYKKARMLLFPTHLGPDNIPPLEAMSYGCAVAVSDVPGAREQFGEAANYFNPNSIEEIKRVILRAAKDPQDDDKRIELGIQLAANCSPANYVYQVMLRLDLLEKKIWNSN
ncbi:glycosyltransferase family 4 protein [Candidatus Planktophila versatilis]|uniref:glycosyltransferase family 4 protein n=1 Tax=Candidatus Planktophila versatilis TaxID=1884905 RepID=UPI003CEFB00C